MTDLLDARGYEVVLRVDSAAPAELVYLGAVCREHEGQTYDEDPYVVGYVEDRVFTREFSAVLKDEGIRRSGLSLALKAEEGAEISLTVCGEVMGRWAVGPEAVTERRFDVQGLCQKERAYLAHTHKLLYRLLAEVDRICKKHGIAYFLVFGGLLGALRYQDMIPWDDDLDLAMPRADFERFKKIAPGELGEDFRFLDGSDLGNGAFLDFLCRVLYQKEKVPVNVFRKVSGKCKKEIENHLALDIYILDNASDHPGRHKFHMLLVRAVYGLGMGHRAYLHREEYASQKRFIRCSVRFLSAVGKYLPLSLIFWLHERVSRRYEGKETRDYFMSNGYLPFIHTRYSREWFAGCSILPLGDMEVCAPADVKAYLKRAYYDYYHYPPVNKRVPGHSPEADGIF